MERAEETPERSQGKPSFTTVSLPATKVLRNLSVLFWKTSILAMCAHLTTQTCLFIRGTWKIFHFCIILHNRKISFKYKVNSSINICFFHRKCKTQNIEYLELALFLQERVQMLYNCFLLQAELLHHLGFKPNVLCCHMTLPSRRWDASALVGGVIWTEIQSIKESGTMKYRNFNTHGTCIL